MLLFDVTFDLLVFCAVCWWSCFLEGFWWLSVICSSLTHRLRLTVIEILQIN